MSRKDGINDVKKHLKFMGYTIIEGRNSLKRCIEIQAEKDGIIWQFSVMVLSPNKKGIYFGATNSTEWWEGVGNQDDTHKFSFVIVRRDITEGLEKIIFLAPEDVLRFTSIPSLKFNINIDAKALSSRDFRTIPQKYSVEQIIRIINDSKNSK